MAEIPPLLDQEFEPDQSALKLREQGTPQFVLWGLVYEFSHLSLASNRAASILSHMEDILSPQVNERYEDELKSLAAEKDKWDRRSDISWEAHRRRRLFRALLRLMFDRDMYGPKEVFEDEGRI